ncbi:hypothetical protein C6W19_19315 [Bacillus sp. RJGP41]|nr:hypothetical protein C6W19_19315 [Bacillus sp. RJGP41]
MFFLKKATAKCRKLIIKKFLNFCSLHYGFQLSKYLFFTKIFICKMWVFLKVLSPCSHFREEKTKGSIFAAFNSG